MPMTMEVSFGKRTETKSIRIVNGMTPTSGPHSRRVPPSSAMMTTRNEIIGLNAAGGST